MRDLATVEPSPRADELAARARQEPTPGRADPRREPGGPPRRSRRRPDRRDERRPDLRERGHRLVERAWRGAWWRSSPRTPTPRHAASAPRSRSRGRRPAGCASSSTASAGRGGSARPRWRSAARACAPIDDWRGVTDRDGQTLGATMIAIADEVAAAADLARDKASGTPVVVVRGLGRTSHRGRPRRRIASQRARDQDLF